MRKATERDARRIAEVHIAAWRKAYRGHMPQGFLDGLDLEQWAERRRRQIASPREGVRSWVAALGQAEPCGFAVAGPTRDDTPPAAARGGPVAEVYAIYVDPPRWGGGVGRALWEHALADLRARGPSTSPGTCFGAVTLWVLAANARARRFYESAGLRPDGATKRVDFGGAEIEEVRYLGELP